ncbi:tape measure protein [Bacillus sp. IITD106]|nr:tape measure protein [Bacillus sp. IITD106]
METYSVEAYLKATGADKFANAFKNATKNVEGLERSTDKAGLTIGKLVAAAGVTALVAKGFGMVKDSIGKAFGRIDTMEQFERVMTTLTGSSDKAAETLDNVREKVTGTAYGLDVAAQSVQGFVTSNMKVETATKTFGAWADAVAFYGDGTNATLASVTDALAKATAKGKIQMDTMNRLAEAGIPAMQIYADATGKSVEEVAKMMEKGQIKADEFHKIMNDALLNGTKSFKGIEGAAKEAGASWTGSFDNMKAAVTRGVVSIIQNIDKMLKDNGLPDMREMVATFGKKFEEVLNKAANAIPPMVEKIKEVYRTLEPWLPLIKNIVMVIGSFIGTLAVMNTLRNAFFAIRTAILSMNAALLANPIGLIVAAITAAALLVYLYWEPISKFFIDLWEKIKISGIAAWEWLKQTWANTVTFFINVWSSTIGFFSDLWSKIVNFAVSTWDAVKNAWSSTVEFFKNVWNQAVTFFIDVATSIINKALEIWDNIRNVVYFIAGAIAGLYIPTLVRMATSTILNAAQVVASWISMATTATVNGAKIAAQWVAMAARATWSATVQTVQAIPGIVAGFVRLVISATTTAARVAAQWTIMTARATWSATVQAAQAIPKIIAGFARMAVQAAVNGAKVVNQWALMASMAIKNAAIQVAQIGAMVAKWAVLGVQSLLHAAKVAAAWLIAMGPVAIVTALVVGLVALIIANWSKVKTATVNAWNSVKDAISNGLNAAYKFVVGFAVKFVSAGRNIVLSIAKGITSAIGAVTSAIGNVTKRIRNFLPFSPAKEGALRDIMKIQIGESIAKSIDKGKNVAVRSMANLSNAINGEMPVVDIAGNVASINSLASRQFENHLTSELTVNKQPAYINLTLGGTNFKAFVQDITREQDFELERNRSF